MSLRLVGAFLKPAALLQCAIDNFPDPAASGTPIVDGVEWLDLAAVSMACVDRHCGTMMKACIGPAWEAKVDVPYWLKELENLKVAFLSGGFALKSAERIDFFEFLEVRSVVETCVILF